MERLHLDLLVNEYRGHFDYIVILCPTLRYNKNYLAKCWIKEDDCGFFIKPGDKLLEWIKQLSAFFSSKNTLFIVDNMIADETLDKTRGALLVIAISGSHREHSLRGCLLSDIRKSQSPCVTNLNSSSCGSQRIDTNLNSSLKRTMLHLGILIYQGAVSYTHLTLPTILLV